MSKERINIMCDLETLGTRPGCKLLSIAAVTFCTYPEEQVQFYEKIDHNSFPNVSFHIDRRTQDWWKKQNADVADEAFSGTTDIRTVLFDFDMWCKNLHKKIIFWGNGADFDNAILQETYNLLGLDQPWDFRDNRCYRTLKGLYPQVPYTKPKLAHHALEDAKAQARHAELIIDTIGIIV